VTPQSTGRASQLIQPSICGTSAAVTTDRRTSWKQACPSQAERELNELGGSIHPAGQHVMSSRRWRIATPLPSATHGRDVRGGSRRTCSDRHLLGRTRRATCAVLQLVSARGCTTTYASERDVCLTRCLCSLPTFPGDTRRRAVAHQRPPTTCCFTGQSRSGPVSAGHKIKRLSLLVSGVARSRLFSAVLLSDRAVAIFAGPTRHAFIIVSSIGGN